jgi:hypothetical protein
MSIENLEELSALATYLEILEKTSNSYDARMKIYENLPKDLQLQLYLFTVKTLDKESLPQWKKNAAFILKYLH